MIVVNHVDAVISAWEEDVMIVVTYVSSSLLFPSNVYSCPP